MNVIKTEIIPAKRDSAIFDINTVYTSRCGKRMLRQFCDMPKSDTFSTYYRQFSDDNGKTWSEPKVVFKPEETEEGVWRWTESTLFYDEDEDAILFIYNYALYSKDENFGNRNSLLRLFYQISRDGGDTFSEPKQLVMNGYDETHWAPGVCYGKNCAMISFCAPIKVDGGIVLPVTILPTKGMHGKDNQQSGYSTGRLFGQWCNDELDWNMGDMLTLPGTHSYRGLFEPTIAVLETGRLLMVMRGCNGGGYGVISSIPSRKWHTFSDDNGVTWSTGPDCKTNASAHPWGYTDGDLFYSPSSGSRLIRHSISGILYWLGNIATENPQGNLPRHPLVIGRVDEQTGRLIKNSIKTVAECGATYPESVQFSNFRVYEDRFTGEFIVSMPLIGSRSSIMEAAGYSFRLQPE